MMDEFTCETCLHRSKKVSEEPCRDCITHFYGRAKGRWVRDPKLERE